MHKFTNKLMIIGLLLVALLAACSGKKTVNPLNGTWHGQGITLTIDGKDALLSQSGTSYNGKVNKSKKTIIFDDGTGGKEKGKYKLVGNKLSYTDGYDTTYALSKQSSKKASKAKSTSTKKKSYSSSEASETSTVNDEDDTDDGEVVYSGAYATISYHSDDGYFTIKNETDKDIVLSSNGKPTINGKIFNMYDGFASVDVPANGSAEERISLQNSGETLGGDKLREYKLISDGENHVHITGTVNDSDFNSLGSFSFDVDMDESMLKSGD